MFKCALFFTLCSILTCLSTELYSASQATHVPLFVKVKSHFDEDEIGEGNSGYHALKNALILCKLIVSEPLERESVCSQLTDSTLVKKLFGEKTAPWKAYIVEQRRQQFAQDFVRDTLLTALAGASVVTKSSASNKKVKLSCTDRWISLESIDNEQDRKAFIALLPTLAHQLVTTGPVKTKALLFKEKYSQDNYHQYHFTFDDIAATLNKLIEQKLNHASEYSDVSSYKSLCDVQHLKNLLPTLQLISFIVKDDNRIISEHQSAYKRSYSHRIVNPKEKVEAPGTWLTQQEVEKLVQLERERTEDAHSMDLLSPLLNIIPIIYLEGMPENSSFSNHLEYKLKDLVQKLQDPTCSFITILFVHYNTRWFVCVVNKSKNSTQYLFADSNTHTTSETKEFATKLLHHLTGKNSSEAPESPAITIPQSVHNAQQTLVDNEKKLPEVTFVKSLITRDDYAGALPETVEDIIDILKNRQTYRAMGLTFLPPMMLLYGPPGTGKTTLARLIAHETDRLYTEVVASSLLNKYYGEGVKRLRKIFEDARNLQQPVIIFIDEIDAILATSTKEKQRTDLLQIFNNELDKKDPNIFVIGATNRYSAIDATTKSRCRNYCLEIPLPDLQARETIIRHYLSKLGMEDESLCKELSSITDTVSGRELEIMVNQAVIIARRNKADKVAGTHLHKALEKTKNEIQKEKKEERKNEPKLFDFRSMVNHTASAIVSHIALSALIYAGCKIKDMIAPPKAAPAA